MRLTLVRRVAGGAAVQMKHDVFIGCVVIANLDHEHGGGSQFTGIHLYDSHAPCIYWGRELMRGSKFQIEVSGGVMRIVEP